MLYFLSFPFTGNVALDNLQIKENALVRVIIFKLRVITQLVWQALRNVWLLGICTRYQIKWLSHTKPGSLFNYLPLEIMD